MLFNSVGFLIFLPAIALIYYFAPTKTRWVPLLIASCGFYMAWRPEFIILLSFTVFVNYASALLIQRLPRKPVLIVCMAVNFGLLFLYKYLGFFSGAVNTLFRALNINAAVLPGYSLILPMGISFYTFQAAAYTIDVYRSDLPPERNYFKTLLFIAFFPQLVAGPIERAGDLIGQLFNDKKPTLQDVSEGFGYLLLGFFKKAVVADRLADCVNVVYGDPATYAGLPSIIATVFFAFQIYCDFSGYSDIAVGSGKFLGIKLTQNFRQPYLSGSIHEFWRRWHITLSSWLRDYVYIPLGGSRVGKARHNLNIMLTFLASGLWHGANWTFVVWGGFHGLIQVLEGNRKKKNILHVALTFTLVCLTWVFFRAENVGDAIFIISRLFHGFNRWGDAQYVYEALSSVGGALLDVVVNAGLIVVMVSLDIFAGNEGVVEKSFQLPLVFRVAIFSVLFVLIMGLSKFYSGGQFIYFQF